MRLTNLALLGCLLLLSAFVQAQCAGCDQTNTNPGAATSIPSGQKWCYNTSNVPAYSSAITVNGNVEICGGATLDVFGSFTIENSGYVTMYGCSKLKVFGTFNDKHVVKVTSYCGDCGNPSYTPVDVTGSVVFTGVNCQTTLPIELIDFDVRKKSNDFEFTWATASETNNDFFTIEASTDANLWDEVAVVPGSLFSESLKTYSYSWSSTFGYRYFRLKQTDLDNKFTYSETVEYRDLRTKEVQFYPNPVQKGQELTLIPNEEEVSNVKIISLEGKKVFEKTMVINFTDSHKLLIPITIPKGVYFLSVVLKSGRLVTKKIVINE